MHHKYADRSEDRAGSFLKKNWSRLPIVGRHNIDELYIIPLDRSLVQEWKLWSNRWLKWSSLQLKSTEIIRRLSQELNGRLPIIGVGIDSVIAAWKDCLTNLKFILVLFLKVAAD